MSIFNVITLFGGLAMFLYGMRLMGNGLKEGSSGTLKIMLERVTNNPFKAFLLGLVITAIIQSSTATIVITSGLVAAGLLTLHQSLGIIIGANVGTTVTGQIIRLLDLNTSGASFLQVFKPSTLAPVAMIIGIIIIMGFKFKNAASVGSVAMGFGILFTGLMNMTGAVDTLSETGVFESLFSNLGKSPLLGYVTGAGVAFILQSSSATIGILQAFSTSGELTFRSIYAVIVGIYLGDCVTTAIVCSIGAKAEQKRVGVVNILFNLSETVVVLVAVTILHHLGLLNSIWDNTIRSGGIANTNTIFNLGCAVVLFPMIPVYEKLSRKLVKDDEMPANPFADKFEAMNPAFYKTPALAFNSCYNMLDTMLSAARTNLMRAFDLLYQYDEKVFAEISRDEGYLDRMTDTVSTYLVQLSAHISAPEHVSILHQYYKVSSEFERLGDHALNIAETAQALVEKDCRFSQTAMDELNVLRVLMKQILENTERAFEKRDAVAAGHIEPLEEVVDDIIYTLRQNHLERLRDGVCSIEYDSDFANLMTDLERVSDICSNIGIATLVRINPELGTKSHEYVAALHLGKDEDYNRVFNDNHKLYFDLLAAVSGNKQKI